jgi:serine/threonine protein phosphatase PrpC
MSLKELADIATGTGLGKTWKQVKLAALTGRWVNKATVQKCLGELNLDELKTIQNLYQDTERLEKKSGLGTLAAVEIERRRATWGDLGGGEQWGDVRKNMGEANLARLLYAYSRGPEKGDQALKEYLENGLITPTPEFLAHQCKILSKGYTERSVLIHAKENFALAHAGRLKVKTKEERVQKYDELIRPKIPEVEGLTPEISAFLHKKEKTPEDEADLKAKQELRDKLKNEIKTWKDERIKILQEPVTDFSLSDYCRGIVDARKMVKTPSQQGEVKEDKDVNFFTRSVVGQFISGIEDKALQREVAVRKTEKLDDYEKDLDQKKTDESPYGERSITQDQMKHQQEIWGRLTATTASLDGVKDAAKDSAGFRTAKNATGCDFNEIAKDTIHEKVSLQGERGEFKGAVAHCIGQRYSVQHQEDAHGVGTVLYNGKKIPFFAICDGHGGAAAAQFVATNLQKIIQETISGPGDLAARLPLLGVKAEQALGSAREEGRKKRLESQKSLSDAVFAFEGKKVPFSENQLRDIAKKFEVPLSKPLVEKELDDLLIALDTACEKELFGIQGIDLSKHMSPPKNVEERKNRILMMNNLLTNLSSHPELKDSIKLLTPSLKRFENKEDIISLYKTLLRSPPPLPNELVKQATDFFISLPASFVLEQAGTTLTLALPIGDELWAVNVGDSRIVLQDEKGNVTQLTRDESPLVGRASAERRGGRVEEGKSGPRLYSGMEGTGSARSIGDMKLYGVTPRAKVTRCKIPPEGGRLILGCDGLYERMSTHEVGQLTQHRGFKNPEEKAQALVYGSFAMGSEDNISAMVVDIPAKKPTAEAPQISAEEIKVRQRKYSAAVHNSIFLFTEYSEAITEKYPELKNLTGTGLERQKIRFPVEHKVLEEVVHSDNPEALLTKYFGNRWKVWRVQS